MFFLARRNYDVIRLIGTSSNNRLLLSTVASNNNNVPIRRRIVSCSFDISTTRPCALSEKTLTDKNSISRKWSTNSLLLSKDKNSSLYNSNTASTTITLRRTFGTASSDTTIAATTNNDNNDNNNDLLLSSKVNCQKHLELSEADFAQGCSLLRKISLGMDVTELNQILEADPFLSNFQDYDRRTPLHVAASEGHIDLCRALVDTHSAKINRSDRWGGSPLDDAHRHRNTDVVDFLISRDGILGSLSCANNFITAASEGDLEEIQAIWEYGKLSKSSLSLLNKGDYDNRTALHLAARNNHIEICEFLCKVGANVNAKDRWGNRPLDDAHQAANTTTNNNNTNETTAISNSSQECVRILKAHGAEESGYRKNYNYNNYNYCNDQAILLELMQQYGKVRDTTDNNGHDITGTLTMDWHDVKDLLEGIGEENPTDEMVQKLFEVADWDGNGFIDTEEFIENSETFLGGRPARIILVVGGPGSGKGILSTRLVKECSGMVHLSSGDLLRKEVAEGTYLGKQVQDIMQSGGLVSSAVMVTLMKKAMRDHPGKRILLDGFPRSQENARDLVTLCGKPELALHIDCDDTILLERIMKRADSGGTRSDDNFHTGLHRIRSFHKYHNVTMDFLREQSVPIVYLDGTPTAQGVWKQLLAIGRIMRSAVKLPNNKV